MFVWWYATPVYDAYLCRALQYAGVSAEAIDRVVQVTRLGAPSAKIPADQLTYNVILFGGLLGAITPRHAGRVLLALLAIVITHFLALYTSIEATYATTAGAYSAAHYSPLARDVWRSAEFIYRIGGMFAIAFVAWYAATPDRARGSLREKSKAPARREPGSRRGRAPRR
jgi:hypothetical protein